MFLRRSGAEAAKIESRRAPSEFCPGAFHWSPSCPQWCRRGEPPAVDDSERLLHDLFLRPISYCAPSLLVESIPPIRFHSTGGRRRRLLLGYSTPIRATKLSSLPPVDDHGMGRFAQSLSPARPVSSELASRMGRSPCDLRTGPRPACRLRVVRGALEQSGALEPAGRF